jgi:guanine nucleotide-binding protein subunit alpha
MPPPFTNHLISPVGSGESGKSTICKQLKIINHGFTHDELAGWRTIVYRNLLDSSQAIVHANRQFGYGYSTPKAEVKKKKEEEEDGCL